MIERLRAPLVPIAVALSAAMVGGCSAEEAPVQEEVTTTTEVSKATLAEFEKQKTEFKERETRVGAVVLNMDESIDSLSVLLNNAIQEDTSITSEEAGRLRDPINFYKYNKDFALRNEGTYLLDVLTKNGPANMDDQKEELLDDINNFFIDCEDPSDPGFEQYTAAYDAAAKKIIAACNYDKISKYQAVVLYHEIVHGLQDVAVRTQSNYGTFRDLYNQGYLIINFEEEAYAAEMELLNTITNNKLEDAIKAGADETALGNILMTELQAPESDREKLTNLTRYAIAYFGNLEISFKDFTVAQYANNGRKIAEIKDNGDIVELNYSK